MSADEIVKKYIDKFPAGTLFYGSGAIDKRTWAAGDVDLVIPCTAKDFLAVVKALFPDCAFVCEPRGGGRHIIKCKTSTSERRDIGGGLHQIVDTPLVPTFDVIEFAHIKRTPIEFLKLMCSPLVGRGFLVGEGWIGESTEGDERQKLVFCGHEDPGAFLMKYAARGFTKWDVEYLPDDHPRSQFLGACPISSMLFAKGRR